MKPKPTTPKQDLGLGLFLLLCSAHSRWQGHNKMCVASFLVGAVLIMFARRDWDRSRKKA